MKNNKKNKIWFIVCLSVFGFFWLASLIFFGFANLSENITESIQNWYAKSFEGKTLNLFNVSLFGTVLSTSALLITLLFKEIKRRYA